MISDADIEKAAKAIAGVRELYPHDFDLWLTEARAAIEVVGVFLTRLFLVYNETPFLIHNAACVRWNVHKPKRFPLFNDER